MAGCQWIDRGRVSTNLCIEISLLKPFFSGSGAVNGNIMRRCPGWTDSVE